MKLSKSKLGFLLAAIYIFIAGLFFIYARFACSADALYCGMLGLIPALPSMLLMMPFIGIFSLFNDTTIVVAYVIPLLINVVLVYFIGSVIQNKFSQKTAKIISLLAISVAVIVMIILGIRYFNKSDIWKPNTPVNVNNPVNGSNYCQQDSGCVLVSQYQGCCPNGCAVEAVNVETKNREEETRNKTCSVKDYSCPAKVMCELTYHQAVCEQNRCVVKEKQIQNPTSKKQYKIIGSFTSPGESSFVKILGDTAYLTDISEGLLAIDVSNPEKPTLLDKIKIGNGGAYALTIEPNGPFAVVSGYGNSKVALIDIRDPKKLQIIDEIDTKRPVQNMAVVGSYVYLAIDGPEVEVLELTSIFDDSLTTELSISRLLTSKGVFQIQGGGHALGTAVLDINVGDLLTHDLIIAQGESGVGVYKKAEFIMPQFSFVSNVGYVNIVAADENYVYAGVGNAIKVIDLKIQKEIADIKIDDVWNFKVKDNTLYVASGENGVKVLDISEIKNPKEVAVVDTPGRARSIDVSADGKYIYVADDRDDLQIIGMQTKNNQTILQKKQEVKAIADTYAKTQGYNLSEYQAPEITYNSKTNEWYLFYDQAYLPDPITGELMGAPGKHFGIYINVNTGEVLRLEQGE